jgi:hypothetical protein
MRFIVNLFTWGSNNKFVSDGSMCFVWWRQNSEQKTHGVAELGTGKNSAGHFSFFLLKKKWEDKVDLI